MARRATAPVTVAAAGAQSDAAGVRWPQLALAAALLHLALLQPNHPAAMTWQALRLFSWEWPAILLGLAALPPGAAATLAARAGLVAILTAGFLLRTAELASFMSLGRAFHPLLDAHLLVSAWQLGSGAVGRPLMALAAAGALLVTACVAGALWWSTGRWAAVALDGRRRAAAAAGAGLAAGVVVAEVGQDLDAWPLPFEPPGSAFTTRLAVEEVLQYRRAAADLRAFRAAAAEDPWAGASPLLDRIGDRDVLLVFIESYGAASLRNPLYAETHRATLSSIERGLAAAGVAMRSGWLEAPTHGGQSWLSHATLVSGLRVDNQRRYDAYLASGRQGLVHLAQRSGFRTAGVMPAITLDWPEGKLMGFDRILPADALGYQGQPFNWVTMPDQFTLAAIDRLVREPEAAPVFVETALVSSHAPWVPVPGLVPWDEVGDGTVFDRWASSGDPPEVVWRDRDRVRRQFRKAIDYSLSAVGAYALLHAADPPLMIVLGDHPPARFVAEEDGDTVPVSIIGPPELVARVDGWNWAPGLIPADDAPVWPMSAFRDRFLAAFSTGRP